MTDTTQPSPLWQSLLDFSSSEWQTPLGAMTVTAWDGMGAAAALDAGLTMAKAADVISWAEQQRVQLTNLVNATESLIASGKLSTVEQIEVQLMKNTFSANAQQFDDMAKGMSSALGTYLSGAQVVIALQTNDQYEVGKTALSSLLGMGAGALIVGLGTAVFGATTLPAIATIMFAGALFGFASGKVGEQLWAKYADMVGLQHTNDWSLKQGIADLFTAATVATAPVRRDPLTLDLDNDGLETTGVSTANPIYFDHDADGVKTATGWVGADDAFLVLDKNANGKIDNGRELFGDAMIKSNGQLAADGFDALRDLDANLDGKVDAGDAQFANLRLWRDLNQDGVSQANELFTLGSQNIAAINTGSSEHSQILANGNQLADLGSFVKTDGSSGTLGEVSGNLGDINLVQDTFHSQFTDTLDTSTVASLPDMQGAGQVRSLREAATLSSALAQLLTDFAAATSGMVQRGLMDQILKAWSDTSAMPATFTGAYAGHGLTVSMQNLAAGSAAYNALAGKLTILEHFNGRTFNAVPTGAAANDKILRIAA